MLKVLARYQLRPRCLKWELVSDMKKWYWCNSWGKKMETAEKYPTFWISSCFFLFSRFSFSFIFSLSFFFSDTFVSENDNEIIN